MNKVLRSLVLENFPFETRVEIELLSRRRDIVNEEKQEELFKILQKENINNIVPLGPGTNRYAFNLDGFVVKVATDHDGKIDNFKEFKMAKRLYPYVAKTYEVTSNGSMLVAEYIQPFDSYTEMLNYADRIREILKKISAVYLIGDVGICSKNYVNWGIRVGTDDPVCLDFAYVYNVSSSLFICPECNTNSVLIPNKDFTELYCSNPVCGKHKLFEDIRAKIGNDIHRHEIGDLTLEGYELSESFTDVELTTDRSNYLLKRLKNKKVPIEQVQKEAEPDPFIHNIISVREEKEEIKMNMNDYVTNTMVTSGKSGMKTMENRMVGGKPMFTNMTVTDADPNQMILPKAISMSKTIPKQDGPVIEIPANKVVYPNNRIMSDSKEEAEVNTDESDIGEVAFSANISDNEAANTEEDQNEDVTIVPDDQEKLDLINDLKKDYCFLGKFVINAHRAVSTVASRIAYGLRMRSVFDMVRSDINNKKLFPEQFYNNIENNIFMSLVNYLGMVEVELPKKEGNGTVKIFMIPINGSTTYSNEVMSNLVSAEALNTITDIASLKFIQLMYMDPTASEIEDPAEAVEFIQDRYYNSEEAGINADWLNDLKTRLNRRAKYRISVAQKVVDEIEHLWTVSYDLEDEAEVEAEEPNIMIKNTKEEEPEFEGTITADISEDVDNTDQESIKFMNISKCGFSIRTYNCLNRARIVNIDDIIQMDIVELSKIRNLGLHSIEEILQVIHKYGFKLKPVNGKDLSSMTYGENIEEIYYNIFGESPYDEENAEENYIEDGIDERTTLRLEVYPEDKFDIIKIVAEDTFGRISIPIYININEYDEEMHADDEIDIKNGKWNWLRHMIPDTLFYCPKDEVDNYLYLNNAEFDPWDTQTRVAIVNELMVDNEMQYLVGLFCFDGVIIYDDEFVPMFSEDDDLLVKLNIILTNIFNSNKLLSHNARTIEFREEVLETKEYIDSKLIITDEESGENHSDTVKDFQDQLTKDFQEQLANESPLGIDKGNEAEGASSELKPVRRKRKK